MARVYVGWGLDVDVPASYWALGSLPRALVGDLVGNDHVRVHRQRPVEWIIVSPGSCGGALTFKHSAELELEDDSLDVRLWCFFIIWLLDPKHPNISRPTAWPFHGARLPGHL